MDATSVLGKRVRRVDRPDRPDKMAKRERRSLGRVEAEITTREALPDTALEIDIMILDFHAYQTIQSLLKVEYRSTPKEKASLDRDTVAVQAWITSVKKRWPSYKADKQLSIRLQLLRFCAMYCHRATPQRFTPYGALLEDLRAENLDRAGRWINRFERCPSNGQYHIAALFQDDLPVSLEMQQKHVARALESIGVYAHDGQRIFYSSVESISLLDVLPSFVQLCAAVYAMHDAKPELSSLRLITDFMRQACLEQYLVHGVEGCDAIDLAFSFGCYDADGDASMTPEDHDMDKMFRDCQTGEELTTWRELKTDVINEFLQDIGRDTLEHRLDILATKHSLRTFDVSIRSCITDLCEAVQLPVLVQIERGSLGGMSQEGTIAFLEQCGLARPVHHHDP